MNILSSSYQLSPPYQTLVYEENSPIKITSIPLTIALKILTRRLESVFCNKESIPPYFITKANSACDMYQALFQDDIKNCQGNIGLIANWVEVFEYEWKNETEQKEIYKGIVPEVPFGKVRNKKRQIKWQMQGSLPEKSADKKNKAKGKEKEQMIEKPGLQKIEKSEDEKDKTNTFKSSISWADDVEEKFKELDERRHKSMDTGLNGNIQDESDHDNSRESATVKEFFPYLLKLHAKLIYKKLVKELNTRDKLYEMDKVSHISAAPIGKMKKTGQKKRRHEHKLKKHERSLCDGGLMNRKRNVNKMRKVVKRWEIVLESLEKY